MPLYDTMTFEEVDYVVTNLRELMAKRTSRQPASSGFLWFSQRLLETHMSKTGRIDVLDSVRGIAAFIVVIHHCFITRSVVQRLFLYPLADGRHRARVLDIPLHPGPPGLVGV